MESFDTKDCEVMESFDRKFEKFRSKDSEMDVPVDGVLESFDRKFEKFPSKDSDLEESANELVLGLCSLSCSQVHGEVRR